MNSVKNLFLFFGIVSILIASCSKEVLETENDFLKLQSASENSAFKSDCSSFNAKKSVVDILTDKEDVYNHKINMILYHYGQAITKLVADDELLCYMTDEMLTDKNGFGTSVAKLAAHNKNFEGRLNSLLKNSVIKNTIYPATEPAVETLSKSSTWNANAFLRTNFSYKKDQYEPSIYFIKSPKHCSTTASVNILIAEEANECDEVVGWRNGKKIFMSEKDILASNDIYIFVGVAEMDDKKKLYPKTNILTKNVNEQHENMKMLADVDIDVDEHQIKDGYRYERSKKSEIGGFVMQYFLSDIFGNDTSNEEWEDFDPREIHKNDIEDSKIFTSDLDAFDMSTTDFNNGKKAFIGAWESDWYSSGKLIQNPNSNWVAHSVVTKRKFSHEWYFFDSDDLNDWFPNVNNTESFSNNKCMFKLKRKQ